jgi:CMP-N,N'-diacetyllegionaminic acid synthase
MYNNKKILGIIPARGGSKGILEKNIRTINGKPLITWTIEMARNSKYLDRFFVSTDSDKIVEVARRDGADIPFLRPPEFAEDHSPSYEAVIHAISQFELLGETYDYIALLEPTSPLRKKGDIDKAIVQLVDNASADGLVSVGEVHMEHPMIVKRIENEFVSPYIDNVRKIYQRQQADKAYFPYGVIYLSKVNKYKELKTFYLENTIPYFIDRWQNYEVDDIVDFEIIELLINKYI